MNATEDLIGEAEKPRSLRSPVLPPQHEIDAHSLTHQPFRSWCRACQQAKGRGGQHRRQHQEENVSIIQLDYTFMHNPHQAPQCSGRQHTYTILTAIESTTAVDRTMYSSACFKQGLHSISSCTATSLDCARLYEEHLTIRCRNIIDAAGQHHSGRPQLTYKSVTLLTHRRVKEKGKVERFLWKMCSWRRSQHPDTKTTSQKSTSEAKRHLAWA